MNTYYTNHHAQLQEKLTGAYRGFIWTKPTAFNSNPYDFSNQFSLFVTHEPNVLEDLRWAFVNMIIFSPGKIEEFLRFQFLGKDGDYYDQMCEDIRKHLLKIKIEEACVFEDIEPEDAREDEQYNQNHPHFLFKSSFERVKQLIEDKKFKEHCLSLTGNKPYFEFRSNKRPELTLPHKMSLLVCLAHYVRRSVEKRSFGEGLSSILGGKTKFTRFFSLLMDEDASLIREHWRAIEESTKYPFYSGKRAKHVNKILENEKGIEWLIKDLSEFEKIDRAIMQKSPNPDLEDKKYYR